MRRPVPAVLAALVAIVAFLVAAPLAQAGNQPVRDVHYGPLPGEVVTIFEPIDRPAPQARTLAALPSPGSAPAVLLVHGGGWRQQPNVTEQPTVAQGLRDQGFAVFDIDYPQASEREMAFPKQPEAVAAATMWVKEHGAEYGADPENVILFGGSAGGNLVDLVGEQLPGVRAVVELSGPSNLVSLVQLGQEQLLRSSLTISLAMALGCGRETIGWQKIFACTNTALQEQFSPVDNVPGASSCPHWLLFSAEEDLVPVSQQREMLAALQSHGCDASLDVLPGRGHAFGYWSRINSSVYSFIDAN